MYYLSIGFHLTQYLGEYWSCLNIFINLNEINGTLWPYITMVIHLIRVKISSSLRYTLCYPHMVYSLSSPNYPWAVGCTPQPNPLSHQDSGNSSKVLVLYDNPSQPSPSLVQFQVCLRYLPELCLKNPPKIS